MDSTLTLRDGERGGERGREGEGEERGREGYRPTRVSGTVTAWRLRTLASMLVA